MEVTWICVADAAEAKIFQIKNLKAFTLGKEKWQLLKNLTHEQSRKKGTDLNTDRAGHFQKGSFMDGPDPKKHEAEIFAREIVHELEAARLNGVSKIILVLPPAFYGEIKKHIHPALQTHIVKVIEKDYVHEPEKTLEQHVLKQL